MFSALEIGSALSAPLLVLAYVALLPKAKPVRVRARHAGSHRRPRV